MRVAFATCTIFAAVLTLLSSVSSSQAAEADTFAIADGALEMTAPEGWVRKEPRTRIVEVEFEVPAGASDATAGRVTVMGAGGSVEDNISRWVGQFTQADGTQTRDRAKVTKERVAGQEVHLVDISGTFDDSPPFAPGGVLRENYRMLGAIIVTEKSGNHYVKFYGPKDIVTKYEKSFGEMIRSLKAK